MLKQDENPAYQRFKSLLPPSGLYPARWVDIFSNTTEDFLYEDVEVVFIPRDAGVDLDRYFWREYALYNKRWLGDLGNSVSGWMKPGQLNPEKVFGGMLYYGFANQDFLEKAIREFAQIEECGWARLMNNGLLSEALEGGAQNRNRIENALRIRQDPWASDMLAMFNEEH